MNFEPNDKVWVCLSPLENIWKQGIVICNVVGIPDSFIIEINSQQYRRNKHDLTFSPPRGEGDGGVVDAEEQDETENRTDKLQPRPALKFPKLPMQATLQTLICKSEFEHLNIHVCASSTVPYSIL